MLNKFKVLKLSTCGKRIIFHCQGLMRHRPHDTCQIDFAPILKESLLANKIIDKNLKLLTTLYAVIDPANDRKLLKALFAPDVIWENSVWHHSFFKTCPPIEQFIDDTIGAGTQVKDSKKELIKSIQTQLNQLAAML